MNKALQVLFDRGFVKDCTDLDALSDLMDSQAVTFYLGVDPSGKEYRSLLTIECENPPIPNFPNKRT